MKFRQELELCVRNAAKGNKWWILMSMVETTVQKKTINKSEKKIEEG